jgi:TolB protein
MGMRTLSLLIVALCAFAAVPGAARVAHADGKVVLDANTKATKGLYPIAVPLPVGSDAASAKTITDVLSFDLAVASWFKVLDPKSFLADLNAEGMSIEPQKWKDVGAFGVVKTHATQAGAQLKVDFKLYETDKGAVAVLERSYSGAPGDARKLAHKWANEVVKYYTGEQGFFGSSIVLSVKRRGGSSIVAVDFDGEGARNVSNNSSINILPAYSRSGAKVAYTSYMRGGADLYVGPAGGGRPKRVASYQGMNTGASWSPDGSKIALTLSRDGNPEIYIVDAASGKVLKRLTDNRAIDTSPAWSPDGKEIAFVSNREGGPQIFVMSADGSGQKRVSTVSSFNQTPAWSPRAGTRQLAYTILDDASGRYDIVTHDLASGKLTRVTQNQGNNEEPTWAPGGRVIAFASTRAGGAGLYLANADGTGEQRLVYKGQVTSPDWGPVP